MDSTIFILGMYWRIFYGIIRVIIGLALLRLVHVPIADVLLRVAGHELAFEPARDLLTIAHNFLHVHPLLITYFLCAYLIFWGTTDIFLSIFLLKHQLWAFPISLALIMFFIFYELIRVTHTHSPILLTFIIIDSIICWFIYKEYKKLLHTSKK